MSSISTVAKAHGVAVATVMVLWHVATPVYGQTDSEVSLEVEAEIAKWVELLESDTYSARHIATEKLILAGQPAVSAVADAIENGGLETIVRGIYILRQQALTADRAEAAQAAYDALNRISDRRITTASRRASIALRTVNEVRRRRAQQHLEQLGAVLSVVNVVMAHTLPQTYPSIQIGEKWRGQASDLQLIQRITAGGGPEKFNDWMVRLAGKQVTDEWVDQIAQLENIAILELKNAAISDKAIHALLELDGLQKLSIKYCPVTDAGIGRLAMLQDVSRLELYGTELTEEGYNQLQRQMPGVEVDFRQGGFLGIACDDNPCRITTVRNNTAAKRAGLQLEDVITKYNGQPVQTMAQLTRLIAQNKAGDQVRLEILRGQETISIEVQLGAWD